MLVLECSLHQCHDASILQTYSSQVTVSSGLLPVKQLVQKRLTAVVKYKLRNSIENSTAVLRSTARKRYSSTAVVTQHVTVTVTAVSDLYV